MLQRFLFYAKNLRRFEVIYWTGFPPPWELYRLGNSLTEMALIIEWIISSQRRKECEERQKTRP